MHVLVSEDEKGLPGPNSQSIWGPWVRVPPPTLPSQGVYSFGLWLDSRTINRNSQDKTCIDSTWKQSHLKDKGCDVTSISYNACMGVDTQSVSPLHVYRERPH